VSKQVNNNSCLIVLNHTGTTQVSVLDPYGYTSHSGTGSINTSVEKTTLTWYIYIIVIIYI